MHFLLVEARGLKAVVVLVSIHVDSRKLSGEIAMEIRLQMQ